MSESSMAGLLGPVSIPTQPHDLCVCHLLCLSIPISLKDITQPVLVLEN